MLNILHVASCLLVYEKQLRWWTFEKPHASTAKSFSRAPMEELTSVSMRQKSASTTPSSPAAERGKKDNRAELLNFWDSDASVRDFFLGAYYHRSVGHVQGHWAFTFSIKLNVLPLSLFSSLVLTRNCKPLPKNFRPPEIVKINIKHPPFPIFFSFFFSFFPVLVKTQNAESKIRNFFNYFLLNLFFRTN